MEILDFSLIDMVKGKEFPSEPFIFFFDANLYDIPETVIAACKNLPDNCVGVSIKRQNVKIDKYVDGQVTQYVEFT